MEQTQEQKLATAVGAPTTVTLSDGSTVEIRRCRLKHLGLIAAFIKQVAGALTADQEFKALFSEKVQVAIPSDEEGGEMRVIEVDPGMQQLVRNPAFIAQLVIKFEDDLYRLIGALTDIGHAGLVELYIDDAVLVIGSVLSENVDFFIEKVLPIVTKLIEAGSDKVEKLTTKSGQTA